MSRDYKDSTPLYVMDTCTLAQQNQDYHFVQSCRLWRRTHRECKKAGLYWRSLKGLWKIKLSNCSPCWSKNPFIERCYEHCNWTMRARLDQVPSDLWSDMGHAPDAQGPSILQSDELPMCHLFGCLMKFCKRKQDNRHWIILLNGYQLF